MDLLDLYMQPKADRLVFKIAVIYIIGAGCWILFSDELVKMFISNPDERIYIPILKGWGFVFLSGGLLYQAFRYWSRQLETEVEQRKQAETTQHECEERYGRLFDVETDAVILVDCQTRQIIEVNPAAEKMYGFSREEFLRLKITEVSAEPEKTSNASVTDAKLVPLRMHRRKDGTVFPVEVSCSNYIYKNRKTFVAAMRDITQRI